MRPWDYAAIIASFLIIAWFVKVMMTGDDERIDEDEARHYFDAHGHWPDEPESLGGWTRVPRGEPDQQARDDA